MPFTELGKTGGETSLGKKTFSDFNRSDLQSYLSSLSSRLSSWQWYV